MPTALIVEDEAIIALDLATELEGLGYEVLGFARSATHAIEIANRAVPDIAIVDIMLDGLAQGLTVADDLRARGAKVLVISGSADRLPTGITRFLTKPWVRDDLVREIGNLGAAAAD
jgi:CheY-like chemotaxis protein